MKAKQTKRKITINKLLKKSASKTSKMTMYRIASYCIASLIVRIRTQKACKKKVMEANQTKRKIIEYG